ncbi:hypothetical protein GGI00_002383 [Coemansia sp. RSA 2681]|nr:hypothetical protein GGI00_002383 [Coemansia sp. RSA 2681]
MGDTGNPPGMSTETTTAKTVAEPGGYQYSALELTRLAGALKPFEHKLGDQDATGVLEWLASTRQQLEELGVSPNQWRVLAALKLRSEVTNRYYTWAAEKSDYRKSWAGLEEFLVRYYIGTSSELDAFMRAMAYKLVLTEGEVDKSLTTLRSLVELTNVKTIHDLLIKMTVAKLPRPIMLQLLGRPDGLRNLKLDDIGLVLRQYVASRKTATRGEPMDVDAVDGDEEWDELPAARASAVSQRGPRRSGKPNETKARPARRPSFEIFKAWVSREEYDRRAADNVCLGCGKGHRWVQCPMRDRPKDKQD